MSGEWKTVPSGANMVSDSLNTIFGLENVAVQNEETGEVRVVYKTNHQSLGDAIAKGQFEEK